MTTIGFIGGTGPEGKGLAYRFALAGHDVIVGSRSAGRASDAAREIAEHAGTSNVRGASNEDAAREAGLVVLTVPYSAQADTLPPLADACAGKVVVSTGVPLAFDGGKPSMPAVPQGSAAQQAQALLAASRVAGAFHNLSATKLWKDAAALDQDVIVCADDADAKREVSALAEQIDGVRAVDGGPLAASRYVEGITVLLIGINKAYKTAAGVRIVGV